MGQSSATAIGTDGGDAVPGGNLETLYLLIFVCVQIPIKGLSVGRDIAVAHHHLSEMGAGNYSVTRQFLHLVQRDDDPPFTKEINYAAQPSTVYFTLVCFFCAH